MPFASLTRRPALAVPLLVSSACFVVACAASPIDARLVDAPPPTALPPTALPATAQSTPMSGPSSMPATGATALLEVGPGAALPPTSLVASGDAGGPTACPSDMVLVEGEYCTEVEHDCAVEWFAPQNNKRVCEQFKPGARCIGQRVKKRYCIDRYEWPNVKGERPEVMNTFYQAQLKCAAANKRMCTESEWNFACEGPEMKPFPYGYTRDPRKCNGDHEWDSPDMEEVAARDGGELARLWKGVPSGSQPECVSDFGVHDMPGNADEVCAGESGKAKFAAVNTGGPWYSGVRNQCRPKVYTHAEDFYYYFLSFRCCANPEGAANEPRTKRQIEDGVSLGNIERLAGFTLEQMRRVEELKKRGECRCEGNKLPGLELKGPKWLCKTMCGTLLAPGAKDATDATRVLHKSRTKLH